jgi:uncharacterized protein (DUF433 family)
MLIVAGWEDHTVAEGIDRFSTPLYSVSEAATYLGVPTSTFRSWTRGYTDQRKDRKVVIGKPVVTAEPGSKRGPSVPFVGLAEGLVLAAFRRQGVPLQRIRPAIDVLKTEIGLEHALASKALYTDGAEVLYDFANQKEVEPSVTRTAKELVVVRNNQRVFTGVVDEYLSRLEFGTDNYVTAIHLPGYGRAKVIVDPRLSFGKPVFETGGARVSDALDLFWAGEDLHTAAEEFGVPPQDLEDALRVASHSAA